VLAERDVHLLATVYRSRRNVAIVARRGHGIAQPRDFAGKRLGVVPDTGADYFADLYLAVHGTGSGKVVRVPVAAGRAEQALIDGDVDAVALFHPYSSRLIARLGDEATVFIDPAAYQMRFNVVSRSVFFGSRPKVAQRFLLALYDALLFLRDNPDDARRLTAQRATEGPLLFDKIWEASDFTLSLDQALLSVLDDEARWALARGVKTQAAAPNFLRFIDARPLQDVRPHAVTLLLP
jgi:NitT/TauT family transport system substrate-binding protein